MVVSSSGLRRRTADAMPTANLRCLECPLSAAYARPKRLVRDTGGVVQVCSDAADGPEVSSRHELLEGDGGPSRRMP